MNPDKAIYDLKKSEFASHLLAIAKANSYIPYDFNTNENIFDPTVVLVSTYHRFFQPEVADILERCLEESDKLLLEGGNRVVDLKTFTSNVEFVNRVMPFLRAKNIYAEFDDNTKLALECIILCEQINELEKKRRSPDEERELTFYKNKFSQNLKGRDTDYFLPAIIMHSQTPGRVYQTFGLLHVISGVITRSLKDGEVCYVSFVPEKLPNPREAKKAEEEHINSIRQTLNSLVF